MPSADLLVPGDLQTLTGGYIYDRRIVDELVRLGWDMRVHSLDASFPEPTEEAAAAAAAVLAELPDGRTVIVDGLALTGLRALLPAHTARLDLVALIHHPLAYETGLGADAVERLHAAERDALALVERVVVTSRWTRDALADFDVAPGRITVIEPGTDPAPLSRRRTEAVRELLCVASLTERKGHVVLIEALGSLRDRDWHLTCVGNLTREPLLVERLRAQIARHGLDEKVSLIGEKRPDELGRFYARADLFVLASYMEGYGMAFAEALARGLPIVATTGGAIVATVPAAASRLVPPGDAAALAAALAGLLDDAAALEACAAAAAAARDRLPTWPEAGARFARALRAG
jgi:glycosyltransferase involved in cell wall biosynthesis